MPDHTGTIYQGEVRQRFEPETFIGPNSHGRLERTRSDYLFSGKPGPYRRGGVPTRMHLPRAARPTGAVESSSLSNRGDRASQVLARLDEDWAAVNGSVQPGNDKTPLTEAMFLLTYAQWYRRGVRGSHRSSPTRSKSDTGTRPRSGVPSICSGPSENWSSLPWLVFWSALWGLAEAYGSLWPRDLVYPLERFLWGKEWV